MNKRSTALLGGISVAVWFVMTAVPSPIDGSRNGSAQGDWLDRTGPTLRSADVLTFAPEGTLFVGDSRGSAVFAVAVDDAGEADTLDVTVPDVDDRIAARLGTTARDLAIRDMAVHPRSRNVYLSVARERRPDSPPVLVRIVEGGRIDVLDLGSVRYAKTDLPRVLPDSVVTNSAGRNWTISDMAVIDGQLFVGGLSNEEFSSTMRRIALPFSGRLETTGMRMYHTHHSRYETQSPVTAFAPYRRNGKTYLIAAYGCTPVVLFPVDSLRPNARVTGTTIAELGAGNNIRDIVPFEYGGQSYVVLSPRRRSLQMLDANALEAAPGLDATSPTPKSTPGMGSWETWGLRHGSVAQAGVMLIADYDARHLLALQRDIETGTLTLRPMNKPTLWP